MVDVLDSDDPDSLITLSLNYIKYFNLFYSALAFYLLKL